VRTATITVALAATLFALVAGCSSGTGTTPLGTTGTKPATTSTSAGHALPAGGAPAVTNPLDTTKYQQNPCSVLTAAQLQTLSINGPGKPNPGLIGPSCGWFDQSNFSSLDITFYTNPKVRIGLTGPYLNRKSFQLFQPTQVNGYPAVIADRFGHGGKGDCEAFVGTADDVLVDFHLLLSSGEPHYTDACPVAQDAATAGVTTMRSGS
jgi:hypothetical protein